MKRLSFVIPTRGRPELLRGCLDSLAAAGLEGRGEAIVVFDGREPQTEALESELRARHPWLRTIAVSRPCGRAAARNLALENAAGEIVYFIDDDVTAPPGFVARVLAAFDAHRAAPVLGGPNLGAPGATPFQRAVDFLLRSPLGAGPMRVRYRRAGGERALPGWCFMLSNFGARRAVLESHELRFPAGCHSAEENLLLHEIEKRAGKPVFCPELFVHHRRRATLASFCAQVFTNGRGRTQITLAAPSSLQAAVLAPPAALAWLTAAAWAGRHELWAAPAALYAAAALFEAARLALAERDPAAALRLPLLFSLAHLSYAAGLLAGVFSGRPVHAAPVPEHTRDRRPARVGLLRDG